VLPVLEHKTDAEQSCLIRHREQMVCALVKLIHLNRGCSFMILMQSASLKMSPELKSVLRGQCRVKGQYTEQWKYFEQVDSRKKRNYENMFFSDKVFFT
jgi:hypothetical protein